jgi:ketosteroid isomerase-like protein
MVESASRIVGRLMDVVTRVRRVFEFVDRQRSDDFLACFADDAVMELPFAPGRMPRKYEGIDEIRGFVTFVRDAFSWFSMVVDAVHETRDPRLVIVEHHSDAVVADNGRPYRNCYATFVRFDDAGQIAQWREYYDAGEVVRAFRR